MRISRVLAVIVTAAAMPLAPAAAGTFAVTTTDDTTICVPGNCSLRGAVIAANASGDADTITLPAGTFTLALGAADEPTGQPDATIGDLDLLSPITLLGAGREQTLIDGGARFRVLNVFGAGPTTVRGVTLQHGSVTNPANSGGAGIQVRGDGQLTLDAIGVRDNSAISTVVGPGNGASEAGADACRAIYPNMDAQTLFGAGIETYGGDNPTITVTRSAIERNTLSDVVAAGDCNRSPRGGGISIGGGTMVVEDSVIRDNIARVIAGPGVGVGIYVPGGTGGGISVAAADRGATPVLTVRRSTIVGNHADGTQWSTGGGLAVSGLTYAGPPNTNVVLENATVVANLADGTSPGIATTRGPIHILASFSTFAGNIGGAGGYSQVAIAPDPWDNGMELRLRSSVIEAGTAPGSLACNADLDTVDHVLPPTVLNPGRHTKIVSEDGLNVVSGDCTYGTFSLAERFAVGGSALLGPLAGEFVPSMAPLDGSPALNRGGGCSLTLDGRGYPRPLGGGCDSGAAERQVGIANLAGPTITGVPALGTTVGVDPGVWTTHRGTTAYQWQRCPLAGTCSNIAGATGATYAPTIVDVGGQLQDVLTASSDDDPATATATSARSGVVLAAPPTPAKPGTGPAAKGPAKGTPRVRAAVITALTNGCAKGAKHCAPAVAFRLSRAAKVTVTLLKGKKVVYRRALAAHAGRNRVALPSKLRRGSYRVTIRSAGGSPHSLPITVS